MKQKNASFPELLLLLVGVTALHGCATSSNFARAMDDPIKLVKKTTTLAADAANNATVLQLLGASEDRLRESEAVQTLACGFARSGPSSVVRTLSVYADGLEIVQDIGAAPEDKSYAGYIRQFKKNREALNSKATTAEERRREVATQLDQRQERCQTLLTADLKAGTVFRSSSAPQMAALPAAFGILIALDKLSKAVLGSAEQIQRELALRRALKELAPQFDDAANELAAAPRDAFGPRVMFPADAPDIARERNSSVLGATLTIDRWTAAKTMQQQWLSLASCRAGGTAAPSCLGDPQKVATATAFASNAQKFYALSQLDPQAMLQGIRNATTAAQNASKIGGIGGMLDALTGFASALSDIDDAYQGFEASRP